MKTKVLLAALLVAAVPTVSLFASCSKQDNKQNDDKQQTEQGDTDDKQNGEDTDPLEGDHSPNVPADLRFDGETFSVLIGSTGQHMYAEEETTDLVTATVYNDNLNVEDRFGITLNSVKGG